MLSVTINNEKVNFGLIVFDFNFSVVVNSKCAYSTFQTTLYTWPFSVCVV